MIYDDQTNKKEHDEISHFVGAYLPLLPRVFCYSIFTALIIVFSPCLLYGIVRARRARLYLHDLIRFQRNSDRVLLRAHEDDPLQNNLQFNDMLPNDRNEYSDEWSRENSFNEMLMNLLHGQNVGQRASLDFNELRRVKFEDEKQDLDYQE